jgi:hypothetical protein
MFTTIVFSAPKKRQCLRQCFFVCDKKTTNNLLSFFCRGPFLLVVIFAAGWAPRAICKSFVVRVGVSCGVAKSLARATRVVCMPWRLLSVAKRCFMSGNGRTATTNHLQIIVVLLSFYCRFFAAGVCRRFRACSLSSRWHR